MTEYITEQEQIQQLKDWVKQYGLTILTGITLALVITTGWRYWQNYHEKMLIRASSVYDEMLTSRAQGNASGTMAQAKKLLEHYGNTPYASMASFMLAREAVLKKNYSDAITQLNSVIDHSKDPAMREIARLRIARILITEKKPQDALNLLRKIADKNFNGLVNEISGDAYLAMGNQPAARKAYQAGLQELPNAEVTRPILQMKLDNLS